MNRPLDVHSEISQELFFVIDREGHFVDLSPMWIYKSQNGAQARKQSLDTLFRKHKRGHLVVVEDESEIRELLVEGIERTNATVIGVGSAEEALKAAKKTQFDAIITFNLCCQ